MSQGVQQIIVSDIFGKHDLEMQYVERLVDAGNDVQCEEELHSLCEKWGPSGRFMEPPFQPSSVV